MNRARGAALPGPVVQLYPPGMTAEDFSLTALQVRAAQAGDREAMEELFSRYLPRVARIVGARMGCDWRELALADDLVQETFLDAYTALQAGKILDEAGFCAWLSRCIQTNLQDQLRRGRAEKRGRGKVARFADLAESWLSESMLVDGGATPSQHAGAGETEERLERALLDLHPRYREVICLRAYCGMTYAEIAERMGLSGDNAANVLFLRARKGLQRLLDA